MAVPDGLTQFQLICPGSGAHAHEPPKPRLGVAPQGGDQRLASGTSRVRLRTDSHVGSIDTAGHAKARGPSMMPKSHWNNPSESVQRVDESARARQQFHCYVHSGLLALCHKEMGQAAVCVADTHLLRGHSTGTGA